MSINFYNQNAQRFFDSTKELDISSLVSCFLPFLPVGGHILDAGCGSGRDSRYFKTKGYKVTAVDASISLAALAERHINQSVKVCTFLEITTPELFDGIWACASLLHVPSEQLPETFAYLCLLLRQKGAFYCSFKYGDHDLHRDGRDFTHCDEKRLALFIKGININIYTTWITADLRPGRENELWFNCILIKK